MNANTHGKYYPERKEEEEQFRWIANNIDISAIYKKLPQRIRNMIAEIEQADRDDNIAVYYTVCDDLEMHTKLLIPDILTDYEWDMICEKYCVPYE